MNNVLSLKKQKSMHVPCGKTERYLGLCAPRTSSSAKSFICSFFSSDGKKRSSMQILPESNDSIKKTNLFSGLKKNQQAREKTKAAKGMAIRTVCFLFICFCKSPRPFKMDYKGTQPIINAICNFFQVFFVI